jgi:hypothetical protein
MQRVLPLLIVVGAGVLAAQENPLSSEAQQSWTRTKTNLIGAAEKMAEENYTYKPVPESQSFKDLVAHTADSAMGVCSGYNGEPRKIGAASKTAKADLVAALKEGIAECDKAYSSLSDAKATEMIDSRGGKRSRLGVLYGNTIHLEHEYAQMAVHLRSKGVVPPSSERRRP